MVLAPMAGVTNAAFRRLCRQFGAGLYVSEMVNARGLAEGGERSWELAAFDPDESPRSIQLYGTDPAAVSAAVSLLIDGARVDHIDLNFGCPVRKVTRHGGGAAVPVRPALLASIIAAAVAAAGPVPVTVKMRLGIDHELLTYLEAGRIAQDQGVAAVSLHARTAAQLYSGRADWTAIARLKQALDVPVLGNGDVWTAAGRAGPHAPDRRRRRGHRARLPGPALAVPGPGRRLRRSRASSGAAAGGGDRPAGGPRPAAGGPAGRAGRDARPAQAHRAGT